MSDETPLTGKAKKAKRSEERHKKGKKRSRDGTVKETESHDEPALPVVEEGSAQATDETLGSISKERTRNTQENDDVDTGEMPTTTIPKKRRKQIADAPQAEGDEQPDPATKARFIVFIGNLPYSATDATLTSHFAAIQPTSIRHRTDPKTKKSKGFAFLEFANYDRMKTCLKTYHHSTFDSGIPSEKKRKINVELTAGGGGSKSEARKEKVKVKNERLTEQRVRRAEAAAKEEGRKAKKGVKKEGEAAGEKAVEEVKEDPNEGIHPARLKRMQSGR